MKKRTTFSVETERFLIISITQTRRCEFCGADAAMVTLNEAARIFGISERDLCRDTETNPLHFKETDEGQALVCLSSLTSHYADRS